MAVASPPTSSDQTGRSDLARPAAAAGAGLLASLAWGSLLVIHWTTSRQPVEGPLVAYQALWLSVAAITAVAALALLVGRRWAHHLILATCSLTMIGSLAHLTGSLLWSDDEAWSKALPLLVSLPMLLGSVICMTALVLASAARSRLRYASVATVSVAAALALAVVVNMVAQKDYVRRSAETLGRFGPTERTQRIIESLDQPVRLTCAYTSTDPKRLGRDYGPRVLELLNDMAEHGRRNGKLVTVVNADDDVKRAEIIAELNEQSKRTAKEHVAFLTAFGQEADVLVRAMGATAQEWRQADQATFCSQWGLQTTVAKAFADTAEKLQTRRQSVQAELQGSALPDYGRLAQQTRSTLAETRDNVRNYLEILRRLRSVPSNVRKNRPQADAALQQCAEHTRSLMAALGPINGDLPARPADTLREYVRLARETAAAAQMVAVTLQALPGEGNAPGLGMSRLWQL